MPLITGLRETESLSSPILHVPGENITFFLLLSLRGERVLRSALGLAFLALVTDEDPGFT